MLHHSYTFQYTRNEFLFKAKIVQIEQHATIARCNEFEIEFRKCPRSLDSARITVRNFRSSAFSRRGETISRFIDKHAPIQPPRAAEYHLRKFDFLRRDPVSFVSRRGPVRARRIREQIFHPPKPLFPKQSFSRRVASSRCKISDVSNYERISLPSSRILSAEISEDSASIPARNSERNTAHTHTHTHTRSSPIRKSD